MLKAIKVLKIKILMHNPLRLLYYALSELKRVIVKNLLLNSFSQNGEDLIVDKLLKFKTTGFYVDVGAYDPTRFSNTKRFYQRGWHGINIEPDTNSYNKFCKQRPRDLNLNIGIGNNEGEMTYYEFIPKTLSTFSNSEYKKYVELGYKVNSIKTVRVETLSAVLSKYCEKSEIDFLSVDTEGYDMEVLMSNNWYAYKPRIICVETESASHNNKGECEKFLTNIGYKLVCKTKFNAIYLLE